MTGSGTANDPYKIYNVTDLQNVENDLTAYYELANDIDASATSTWNAGKGFLPIAYGGIGFTGHFDGKGFTISSLFINRVVFGDPYGGLFTIIDGTAVIQNVHMTGVNITVRSHAAALVGYVTGAACSILNCSSAGSIEAAGATFGLAGGLIGYIEGGTVTNCHSSCSVVSDRSYAGGLIASDHGAIVSRCSASGTVTVLGGAGHRYAGGLVGYIDLGVYTRCFATGAVTVGDDYAGGFVGFIRLGAGSCTDCYARGAVHAGDDYAGGFAGSNEGTLDNCYSTGAVTAGGVGAGGLVGEDWGAGVCTDSFWDTETSGQAISAGGTGKTSTQMKTQSTFTDAGWDFTTPIWYINPTINDGYPAFIGIVRRIKGNPNIDQLIYHHVERMGR